MWTILLSCVLFAWYLYALVTFFRGAGRNGWSAWWLLPILICPPSVVVLLARTRRAQLRTVSAWETVCLVAVAALYLLCLRAGRAVTVSR